MPLFWYVRTWDTVIHTMQERHAYIVGVYNTFNTNDIVHVNKQSKSKRYSGYITV